LSTTITYIISVPQVPTNFTSVASSSSSIGLSWGVIGTDQDGFSIERSTDGVNFSVLATTTAFVRTYLNSGLSSGTYYYKIRAYNALGYSGYATTTSTTLP
jgi:titin